MSRRRAVLLAMAVIGAGAMPVVAQSPLASLSASVPHLGWQDALTGGTDKLDVAGVVGGIWFPATAAIHPGRLVRGARSGASRIDAAAS